MLLLSLCFFVASVCVCVVAGAAFEEAAAALGLIAVLLRAE
jgi:hypothetical protein